MTDRLADATGHVARLVEALDALPGVVVERASREGEAWVVRVVCTSAAARAAALEALGRAGRSGVRPGEVHVRLRVG